MNEEAKAFHQKHLKECPYCLDPKQKDDSPEYQKHLWHERECHICYLSFMDNAFNID